MKKKIVVLVVAVLAIAGLVGAMFFLQKNPATEEEVSSQPETVTATPEYLIGGGEEGLFASKVHIKGLGTEYTVNRLEEGAEIEGFANIDTSTSVGLLAYGENLLAKETVEKGSTQLAVYGLDVPQATATYSYDSGDDITLSIGAEAPGGEGFYATTDNSNVYLIPTTTGNNFFRTPLSFIPTTITPGGVEQSVILSATLSGSVRKEPIVIEALSEDDQTSVSGFVLTSHKILSPTPANVDMDRGMKLLQEGLFGLTADAVVGVLGDETYAPASLELPKAVIPSESVEASSEPSETIDTEEATSEEAVSTEATQASTTAEVAESAEAEESTSEASEATSIEDAIVVSTEESATEEPVVEATADSTGLPGEWGDLPWEPYSIAVISAEDLPTAEGAEVAKYDFTLLVSPVATDGTVQVVVAGSPVVYKLSAAALPWLTADTFDLMTRTVLLPFINNISSAELKTRNETTTFAFSYTPATEEGKDDDVVFLVNDEPLDDKNFRQFYQTMISTSYSALPEEEVDLSALTPTLVLTYNYREGGNDVITFYSGPARMSIVTLNDGAQYYVLSSQVDRILDDLPRVVAGETVRSAL